MGRCLSPFSLHGHDPPSLWSGDGQYVDPCQPTALEAGLWCFGKSGVRECDLPWVDGHCHGLMVTVMGWCDPICELVFLILFDHKFPFFPWNSRCKRFLATVPVQNKMLVPRGGTTQLLTIYFWWNKITRDEYRWCFFLIRSFTFPQFSQENDLDWLGIAVQICFTWKPCSQLSLPG